MASHIILVTEDIFHQLAIVTHMLGTSRLDYCNEAAFVNCPEFFELVQNAAVRLLTDIGK